MHFYLTLTFPSMPSSHLPFSLPIVLTPLFVFPVSALSSHLLISHPLSLPCISFPSLYLSTSPTNCSLCLPLPYPLSHSPCLFLSLCQCLSMQPSFQHLPSPLMVYYCHSIPLSPCFTWLICRVLSLQLSALSCLVCFAVVGLQRVEGGGKQ